MNENDLSEGVGSPGLHGQETKSGNGTEARPPNVMLGGIIGYTLGFLIAAAVVVLVRMMDSESDGMRAMFHSLAILGPALVLVVVMWVMHKRSKGGRISKGAGKLCAIVGLASGAAIWVTAPTNEGMAVELMDEHRDLIHQRAEELAACRAQIDDYPKGSLGERITDEQLAGLKLAAMDFRHSEYGLSGSWNALLTTDTDYARLNVGTDPDSIMDAWGRPDSGFHRPSDYRYSYGLKDKVDDIAMTAYGDDYLWLDKLERLITELKQMKYVVIVRMDELNTPLLTGDNFQWGYLDGEAFCFDLPEKKLIGAFRFAATNSEKVSYNYAKNSNVTAQADSAGQALNDDLVKNGWLAFWVRLHEVAEAAVSPFSGEELPYKPIVLAEAMLVLQKKRSDEEARKKAVLAELEGGEILPKEPAETGDVPESEAIQLSDEEEAEVWKLLNETGKIAAIKRLREITGKGLKECKDYVDALEGEE